MEYLNFSSFNENDFDEIIFNAGGKRYTDDPSINELNCDYILDDVVIELKIIEEEPISKIEKQKKFVELFSAESETVILVPTEEQKYSYNKILATPIKSALKKASKQLQVSQKEIDAKLKIAMIMNNGLYMVSQDEFLEIVISRAKNDTSGIDILIVCSMHYYSDKFDMNIIFNFKDFEINKTEYRNKEQIINKLRASWNKKTEEYLTSQMTNKELHRTKEPIKDLYFEVDGIRYIKPSIQWGKASEFWVNGRPREDSTTENDAPLIWVVPMFNEESYQYVKKFIADSSILKDSLNSYMEWIENNSIEQKNKIVVKIYIELEIKDLNRLTKPFQIDSIQKSANAIRKLLSEEIRNEMSEYRDEVICNNYILVEVIEIGMDKSNDIVYISHITNNIKQEMIIEGKRLKYEYAIEVAIALCMIVRADKVYYIQNEDYKWK